MYPSSVQSNSSGAVEPPTGLKSMSFTVPLVATYTSIVSAGRQTCICQGSVQKGHVQCSLPLKAIRSCRVTALQSALFRKKRLWLCLVQAWG